MSSIASLSRIHPHGHIISKRVRLRQIVEWSAAGSLLVREIACIWPSKTAAIPITARRLPSLFKRALLLDGCHPYSNRRCSSSFFLDLHQTTQSFDLPIFFDHCSCSDSDKLSHTTTVGLSSSSQNFRSPCLADWKKGGADITASPSEKKCSLLESKWKIKYDLLRN